MIKMNKKIKQRILSGLLLISSVVPILTSTQVAEAHNAYYLQCLINESNNTYAGNVTSDRASLFRDESKHYEATLGDFSDLTKTGNQDVSKVKSLADDIKSGDIDTSKVGDGSKPMPLTFPAFEVKPDDKSSKVNDATSKDSDRATSIKDILIPDLNNALILLNGGKTYKTVDDLIEATQKLLNKESFDGYTITYGKRGSKASKDDKSYDYLGIWESDHVLIVGPDKQEHDFIYRIPKGYKSVSGRDENGAYPLSEGDSDSYEDDAEYITWDMLAYEATYAYYGQNVANKNASDGTTKSSMVKQIVSFLTECLESLKNALSLYSVDDLVFNLGTRGNAAQFYNGVMPTAWEKNVVTFHWIFQAIAWCILVFSIVKSIIDKNLSTINAVMRVSLINRLQHLLVAGFALTLLFPIFHLVTKMNYNIVNIFSAAGGKTFTELVGDLNNAGDSVGSLLLALASFGMSVYLNFLYITRAFVVSLLMAASPLFVVFATISANGKQITSSWIKEILANIFLQSFHAFVISFFTGLSFNIRGIEGIVLFISLIPLTALFKSLIFKDGGSTTSRLAEAGTFAAAAVGGSVLKGAGKGIGSAIGSNGKSSERYKPNTEAESIDGTKTPQATKGKTEKTSTNIANSGSISADDGGDLSNIANSNNSPLKSKISNGLGTTKDVLGKALKSDATIELGKGALNVAKGVTKGTAMAAGGVVLASAGAAAGDKHLTELGAKTIGSGLGTATGSVAKGVGTVGNKAIGGAKKGYDAFKNRNADFNDISASESSSNTDETSTTSSSTVPRGNHKDNTPSEEVGNLQDGFVEAGNNETSTHYRNKEQLQESGIDDVHLSNGNYDVTYSGTFKKNAEGKYELQEGSIPESTQITRQDINNIQSYANAFSNPNSAEAQHLKKHGINDVSVDDKTGKATVSYNKVGQKNLNCGEMHISGSGANTRLIEKKSIGQEPTKITTNIPPMQSRNNTSDNK